MKNIKLILLTVVILLCFKQLNATALAPTSYGSYYSGIKLTGKQIVFSGSGSYDNDAQANGYTPRWEWDFQYNGSSFVVRANTTSSLANWTYTTKGTFTVAVRYWDNDNQCGSVYTFTIKIAELETLYYVKDHLGNIRVTVDNQATIKGFDDYDPYGLQLDGRSMNNANDNAKYKYSSKELDKENGFNCYYFGARYYDPAIGRWLAVDPLASKYPALSSYNYCADNPIKNLDPNGKEVKVYTEKLGSATFIRGTGPISGRILGSVGFRHSFMRVTTDKYDVIIELGGPRNNSKKGQPMINPISGKLKPREGQEESKVNRPQGAGEKDYSKFEDKIVALFDVIKDNLPDYGSTGPNSNGFIQFLIEANGGGVDLPMLAIAKEDIKEYWEKYKQSLEEKKKEEEKKKKEKEDKSDESK